MKARSEILDYIKSVSGDLSRLADSFHWDMLSHLFSMARLEADRIEPSLQHAAKISLPKAASNLAGFWEWDVIHDRLFGDEVTADLFNLDRDAGRRGAPIEEWKSAVHPDDLDYLVTQLMNSVETGSEYNFRFRVVAADQTIRHVQANGRCLFDPQNRPTRFPGTVRQVPAERAVLTDADIDVIMQRGRQTH